MYVRAHLFLYFLLIFSERTNNTNVQGALRGHCLQSPHGLTSERRLGLLLHGPKHREQVDRVDEGESPPQGAAHLEARVARLQQQREPHEAHHCAGGG